jgi:DNA-binding PadR family transcriptional regulator
LLGRSTAESLRPASWNSILDIAGHFFYFVYMPKGEYLGDFEQLVLLALVRLSDNAYGVTIRGEIESCTGRSPSIGAVYATLDRLQAKGHVSSRLADPTAQRGGRAKRYFRMERSGIEALKASQTALRNMWQGIEAEWSQA